MTTAKFSLTQTPSSIQGIDKYTAMIEGYEDAAEHFYVVQDKGIVMPNISATYDQSFDMNKNGGDVVSAICNLAGLKIVNRIGLLNSMAAIVEFDA